MVAYGETLRRSRRPGWEDAYVNYDRLKDLLDKIEALGSDDDAINAAAAITQEGKKKRQERALKYQGDFLALLRREIEKVSLFCLSRQGEIAEAVGVLKFDDQPGLSIVPRTVPELQHHRHSRTSSRIDEEDDEEEDEDDEYPVDEETATAGNSHGNTVRITQAQGQPSHTKNISNIASHLGEEAALLPSGSIVTGPLKTPKASNRKAPTARMKSTPPRPLFQARQSLQESYTESTHKADRYTEQGVELLHILRFICVNAMALRKIIKKHDKTMMQMNLHHHPLLSRSKTADASTTTTAAASSRRGEASHHHHHRKRSSAFGSDIFSTSLSSYAYYDSSMLVDGPEDHHLQQLANSASMAAIHSSLVAALHDAPLSLHYIPHIRLQCTVSSIHILREYATRMEETFRGFLATKAMISNSAGLSRGTQQALQLIIRFQPDSLLFLTEPDLNQWQSRVLGHKSIAGTHHLQQQQQQQQLLSTTTEQPPPLEEDFYGDSSWGGVNAPSMIINLMSALLYTVNYYIVAPTANHYAILLGVDGAFGATLVGASSMAAIFAAFLYSLWYTTSSFRSALICSALCPLVGNLLYALAISFRSMSMALVGRMLVGFGSAEVVNRQLISACVSFRYMTAASALFVAASAIGMSVGPLLAAILELNAGRDKQVDIPLPWWTMVPHGGGIIFNHVTSPGFVMAFLWFLEFVALLVLFREPERVNTTLSGMDTSSESGSERSNANPTKEGEELTTNYGTTTVTAKDSSGRGSDSSGWWQELVTVKNLVFGNVALPITMLLFGYIELVDEVLISSCSMITRRYFNWHGSTAGVLLASLGALVLPAHYFVENASHHHEERAIMKWSILFIMFGLFAILNYEGLVFDIIGIAVEAVEPGDFSEKVMSNGSNGTSSTTGGRKEQLDISVGGASITTFLNKHLEVPYDWGAGLYVYITFLSAIFMGTIILEGVDTSLMAQKTPPALNDTFINSGLLATLVGTLGRVVGDSIITFSALVDSDIFTDFVNATFFPMIPLALIGYILVRRNYKSFISE